MQEVFNFILSHWETLLSVAMFIGSVVVFIVRKRPVNDIVSWIFKYAKEAILAVEYSGINYSPAQKLENAKEMVRSMLKVLYPDINAAMYNGLITEAIEAYLETPQKHKKG